MRQTALIILCAVLSVFLPAGCGAEDDTPENKPDNPPAETPPAETPSTEAPTEDDADAPRVTSTEPVNGKNDVDPATTDIVVKFSEDMLGMAALLERVDGFEYPENTGNPRFKDPRTLVLEVRLDENKKYALGINQRNETFKTVTGKPVKPFALKFGTGKDYSRIYGWSELAGKQLRSNQACLAPLVREGDKIRLATKLSVRKNVASQMQGMPGAASSTFNQWDIDQVVTDEILEIRNGGFQKLKRSYGKVMITTTVGSAVPMPGGMPPQSIPQEQVYSNQQYLLQMKGDSYKITTSAGGIVSGDEKTAVEEEVIVLDILPADKITSVGDTFAPGGKWMHTCISVIAEMTSVKMERLDIKMTLDRIRNVNGGRSAEISIGGKCVTRCGETGEPCDYAIKGKIIFDVDTHRFISLEMSGAGQVSGQLVLPGTTPIAMKKAVEFAIEMKWTYPG